MRHSSVVDVCCQREGRGSSPLPAQSNLYMTNLSDKKCVPCEGGIPAFEMGEIQKYLKKVDGWKVQKIKKIISYRERF